MLTPQQYFDNALFGIRKQGYKRSVSIGRCRYRGAGGCKCGAGHSLPDDLYSSRMEGSTIRTLIRNNPEVKAHFRDVPGPLLTEVQQAHDDALAASAQYFEQQMAEIAAEHGLTYTEPA